MKKRLYGLGIFILCMSFAGVALALTPMEKLGEAVYNNKNLSANRNQSCKTCHHQKAAFADPVNQASPIDFPVSQGSVPDNFGDRNAPSAAYAGFSPQFHWNAADGLFIGGVFWDGRASGIVATDTGSEPPDDDSPLTLSGTLPTYDPMADQAKGPFQNPIEMALTDIAEVVDPVLNDKQLLKMYMGEFGTPFLENGTVDYATAYNNIAIAIAAFERSSVLIRFSSRFDQFAKEYGGDVSMFGVSEIIPIKLSDEDETDWDFRVYGGQPAFKSKYLTPQELNGLALFNSDSVTQLNVETTAAQGSVNGGMCYLCHLTTPYDTEDYADGYGNNLSKVAPGIYPPLFTDFSYDNLGIPANATARALSGLSMLPNYKDLGLGAQTAIMDSAYGDGYTNHRSNDGKFKVPSLRGVGKSAPYGHNGFFPTLTDVVNFYNFRTGTPEVGETVNHSELGNLGMDPAAVNAIVAFLKTLTDQ